MLYYLQQLLFLLIMSVSFCILKSALSINTIILYHNRTDRRLIKWLFEQNNVLYHYPINHDKLIIGKFCCIACGTKFLFNSANHAMASLSTYPFPLFFEEWGLEKNDITESWDNKGNIIIGNRCMDWI